MGTNNKDYIINEENKEEILNLLRDQDFIAHKSSKELEKIVNNLDFKSLFNIIQNKSILDKISIIQTNILDSDSLFFPNFLDSPTLINKTSHTMIYDMLNCLNSNLVLYYLVVPYIREKLTAYEVIELLTNKEIPFNEVVENDYLFNSITNNLLVNYINKLWLIEPNSKILTKKIIKKLFDIKEEILDSINLDEVNYLFETIKMKNILSIQETKITLSSYRALLSSYLVLGIKKTLDFINDGNKGLNADMVNVLVKETQEYKLTDFYHQSFNILHNLEKNILDNLKDINSKNKSDFTKKVRKNTYLNSLISLMIDNKYITFDSVIDILYNVNLHKDDVKAQNTLSIFCNGFVNYIINHKKKEVENSIKRNALKHFELKKSVREREYRKLCTDVLQRLKLKLFIEALKGNIYSYAFKSDNPTTFLNNYHNFIKEIGLDEKTFIDNILIPLSNGNFDFSSFLNSQGISKPYNYNLYIEREKDKDIILKINIFLKEIKEKYDKNTLQQIIDYICYGKEITTRVHKKDLNRIKELHTNTHEISKEFYFNRDKMQIQLQDTLDIIDDYQLVNYINMQKKIESIIKKTINYLNYHLNTEEIKKKHFKDLLRLTSTLPSNLPFSKANYSLIVRSFTFEDLERIFESFEFQEDFIFDKSLEHLLFDKHLLKFATEGYLDNTFSLGYIISKWPSTKYMCHVYNLDINELTIFDCYKIIQENDLNNENSISLK